MNLKNIFIIFTCLILLLSSSLEAKTLQITKENGIYIIKIPQKEAKKKLDFVSSSGLILNREAHKRSGAILTVNAGFFDAKNEKTISYISRENIIIEDPLFNENLTGNPILRQNLNKILNRTEFRVLECDKDIKFEITPHNAPLDFACIIKTSAQGGPLVYPLLKSEEEFFILKDKEGNIIRESASVLKKTARTIIALKDNDIYVLIITNENPMTMEEVHTLCKEMNFDKAMGFDGGGSTSMNYKNLIDVVSENNGRALKSFMILKR